MRLSNQMTSTSLVEVSNVQLGVFFENWLVIDFVTAKVLPQKNHITTSDTKQVGARLEPLHFLAGKGASTTAAQQLHTLSVYELKLTNTQSVWDRHLPGKVV